jgi:hypothetical protein
MITKNVDTAMQNAERRYATIFIHHGNLIVLFFLILFGAFLFCSDDEWIPFRISDKFLPASDLAGFLGLNLSIFNLFISDQAEFLTLKRSVVCHPAGQRSFAKLFLISQNA